MLGRLSPVPAEVVNDITTCNSRSTTWLFTMYLLLTVNCNGKRNCILVPVNMKVCIQQVELTVCEMISTAALHSGGVEFKS